jgi:hypothetical protein
MPNYEAPQSVLWTGVPETFGRQAPSMRPIPQADHMFPRTRRRVLIQPASVMIDPSAIHVAPLKVQFTRAYVAP